MWWVGKQSRRREYDECKLQHAINHDDETGTGAPCIESGSGGSIGRLTSLNIRFSTTPTPSNTPRRMPHATADPKADLGPLRAARQPPVMNPEMIAFHASSFCRYPFTAQSNVENIPPQTPKLPPVTGARAFMDDTAPTSRSPRGELRAPLIPCHMPPPTAPMENAPPKSFKMTQGHGSRVWSADDAIV